jgi:hypothetical protein
MTSAVVRCLHRLLLVWFALSVLGAVHAQNAAPLSPDRVTFYTEPNFKGEALTVEAGAAVENLERLARPSQKPWLFAISSVRVEGAARATVFSGPGFTGDRIEITGDIADLYGIARGNATWDRAIAAVSVAGPPRTVVSAPPARPADPPPTIVVVPASPRPPPVVHEVRPPMDRRTAEMIVHRAFREVLSRPADPEGLRTYRDRLMFQGWTEQQIIQQLQRSDEARSINADEAITRLYRETLGREPDPQGLAHYRSKWREGWTQGQIRADLRRSHEGRSGHIHNAITRAYRELLGREPDPAGYANYERLMREKGLSERDLRASIMSGDEYRQKHGRR